jgi:hypothetical protein
MHAGFWGGELQGKRQLGRSRLRYQKNIKAKLTIE